MKLVMTNFSLRRPWAVVAIAAAVTVFFAMQFPKVSFDNDPENMLSESEHIRIFHNRVKEKYSLYDFVIVGIVNDADKDGVFNTGTLGRIHKLTRQLLSLRQSDDGLPTVEGGSADSSLSLDLRPAGAWKKALAKAFRHDHNRLFDESGQSAIIGREIISPSVVDNIKQAELGSLKLEYLMEEAPATRDEALEIGRNAMSNPLYSGTLVSEDRKAVCLYIPISEKTYSYNVANLVKALTEDWTGDDRVFITGQPVAQDTFGVEMLVQMATSAPLAGLAVFLLLLLFFKRVSLIIAPMVVAVVSVLCTMGLLIGLGFDVHIMSSMIAIFLMPIAVADSVHILSEFFDLYHRFNDKARTVRHVIGHLFMPMLYTSLTTIAGFASLGATPIPPVRVFGLHVAFGVGLAWILTMTLIPAYIMLFVPNKALEAIGREEHREKHNQSILNGLLERLGGFSYRHWRFLLSLTVVIVGVSLWGVSRIRVNDNPVKWFTPKHDIRVSDEVLNSHFGGTYTAYLTMAAVKSEAYDCLEKTELMRSEALRRFGTVFPEATEEFLEKLENISSLFRNANSADVKKCFVSLVSEAAAIDESALKVWNLMADEINYMDPEGLTAEKLKAALQSLDGVTAKHIEPVDVALKTSGARSGEELMDAALEVCDRVTAASFEEFVYEMEAEVSAPLFKQPEMLSYIEDLQVKLLSHNKVGKTSSLVDALKKAFYELSYVSAPSDASEVEQAVYDVTNEKNRSVPGTAAAVGQVFTQLEGMKKKDSLFHLVTKDYNEANIWIQLKSGDNVDMQSVVAEVEEYIQENPPPVDVTTGWAGLTYLNVVWQKKMVAGMFSSLASSFIVVLVMMMVLFRSPLFGLLSMMPLSVTILFIYGLIGIVGKDYDMPVAVLSALTLGLSVDFAIHFLERAREEEKRTGSWEKAVREMFKEPAMAISRNAITISVGFTPLLFAPLVPYKTVGFFLATIMAVSWIATLFILPALLSMLKKYAFRKEGSNE
jgi:predicted RND superfamily exporter protein